MKPEDLLEQIKKATLACTDMTLVLPHGFKRPKDFRAAKSYQKTNMAASTALSPIEC